MNDWVSMQRAEPSDVQLLRTVEESQIASIHALYISAYTDGLWPTYPALESLTRRIHSALLTLTLRSTQPPSLQPQPSPAVVGFLLLTGSPSDPLLEDVLVHSSHRGSGHGRRLVVAMQAAVSSGELGSAPVERVDCYCAWAVKGFYERCGFGMVRGEQGGRCLMRWAVSGK